MSSTQTQEMPSAPPASDSAANKLDGIPPLTYRRLTTEREKQDALRLVVDSIAQQRQVASASVILHPACLAALVCVCAAAHRFYVHRGLGTLVTMMSAIGIAYLSIARYLASSYIQLAEAFRWKDWIAGAGSANKGGQDGVSKDKGVDRKKSGTKQDKKQQQQQRQKQQQHQQQQQQGNKEEGDEKDKEEDTVLAALYGETIIATVVLRFQARQRRGLIRAWTTKMRYRGKGIGSDMLQFAVQVTRERLGPGASVEFAKDHANSARPLHDMFNARFSKRGERAERALLEALGRQESDN